MNIQCGSNTSEVKSHNGRQNTCVSLAYIEEIMSDQMRVLNRKERKQEPTLISITPLDEEEYNPTKSAPNLSLHPIHSLTAKDIEKAVMDRPNYNNYELVTSGEESQIIWFISGVIFAILVLITVIAILTFVLARKEIKF